MDLEAVISIWSTTERKLLQGFSSDVRYGHFLDDRLTFELQLKAAAR